MDLVYVGKFENHKDGLMKALDMSDDAEDRILIIPPLEGEGDKGVHVYVGGKAIPASLEGMDAFRLTARMAVDVVHQGHRGENPKIKDATDKAFEVMRKQGVNMVKSFFIQVDNNLLIIGYDDKGDFVMTSSEDAKNDQQ